MTTGHTTMKDTWWDATGTKGKHYLCHNSTAQFHWNNWPTTGEQLSEDKMATMKTSQNNSWQWKRTSRREYYKDKPGQESHGSGSTRRKRQVQHKPAQHQHKPAKHQHKPPQRYTSGSLRQFNNDRHNSRSENASNLLFHTSGTQPRCLYHHSNPQQFRTLWLCHTMTITGWEKDILEKSPHPDKTRTMRATTNRWWTRCYKADINEVQQFSIIHSLDQQQRKFTINDDWRKDGNRSLEAVDRLNQLWGTTSLQIWARVRRWRWHGTSSQ